MRKAMLWHYRNARCAERNRSREADRHWFTQEIPRCSWNPKIHYRVYKFSALNSVLTQLTFLTLWAEWDWICLVHWSVVPVLMMMVDECGTVGGMEIGKGNRISWREPVSPILSATNPTWPDLRPNPGLRSGKPATKFLSYGTALLIRLAEFVPQCEVH
jgi:hypothetical protein